VRAVLPFLLAAAVLLAAALPGRAAPDAATIDRLIEQLGDDAFAKRQEAMKRLEEIGEPALEALRKAADARGTDVEVRLRAYVLIRSITGGLYEPLLTITGQPGYWLNRVAFTRDGKQAVAAGGAVIWYDLTTGKEVRRVLERQFARPGLALSADGEFFLTSHQSDNNVRLGRVDTGKEAVVFEGHTKGVWSVALAPDGTVAASGSDDGTVRLWDAKTGKELRQLKGVTDKVCALAFSPDGSRLATGHFGTKSEFRVQLWDVKTGEAVRSFEGHTADVRAVAFLPDGKTLVSAGLDGTVRLWDVESGKELKKLEHAGGIYDAAASPDGKRALTAGWQDHVVRLWDLESGKELHAFDGHTTHVLSVAFSPDGKRALSSDANCTVRLWRVAK
jgi:WD40 repeat protein